MIPPRYLHGTQGEFYRIKFNSLWKTIRDEYERTYQEKESFNLMDLKALCDKFEIPSDVMDRWLPMITRDCSHPYQGWEVQRVRRYTQNKTA
jgi:hypothetical protein